MCLEELQYRNKVIGKYTIVFPEGAYISELETLMGLSRAGIISMSDMTLGAISLIQVNKSWRDDTPGSRTFVFSLHQGAKLEMVVSAFDDLEGVEIQEFIQTT